MASKSQLPEVDLPPVLHGGGWVPIGHESAIRLSNGELQHRVGEDIASKPLGWLRDELPLLDWILRQEKALTPDVSVLRLTA